MAKARRRPACLHVPCAHSWTRASGGPWRSAYSFHSAHFFPRRHLSSTEHPLPTLGTWQGSISPCPVGSWAVGRPGPLPESAGFPGPPAGPAPTTACAERPFSPSRAGVWGLVAAVGQSQGGGQHRQWPLGTPPFMGLAWPSDRPLEALDGGVRRIGKAQLQLYPPQGCLCKRF